MMEYRGQQLLNESDVEQKLVLPLLTTPEPLGLGYSLADIATKTNIRRLLIGKGSNQKLYYPDYIVMLSGMPVLVIEAKSPSESAEDGVSEARLYAHELNSLLSAGVNPCRLIASINGTTCVVAHWDEARPLMTVGIDDWDIAHQSFADLVSTLSRRTLHKQVASTLDKLQPRPLRRPVSLLGGQSVRNEEIAPNTFGLTISRQYSRLFNPSSPEDRAFVVQKAYIASRRRERYVDPIDRTIRDAVLPILSDIPALEDSSQPRELLDKLRISKPLEHQIMLLIGSVGSGKSTFIDYLFNVALPPTTRNTVVWVRVDLNFAPLSKEAVYDWLLDQVISGLRDLQPSVDLDSYAELCKIYAPELGKLKRGAFAVLDPKSEAYGTRLADAITSLQRDRSKTAQALVRYLCGERGRLLVVTLDNCDKRIRDEQLLMFDVAQWLQKEFRCLVVLPLRDVTYDLHRHEPPLDTALKDLVFRIEPPMFSSVLKRRIELALDEMKRAEPGKTLSYVLPSGPRVEYHSSDQGFYLACILRSLYEHDRFVRRIISGIAGRDVRKAMEVFLEFCRSGHIGEDEIFKIMALKGQYSLPLATVANVLLRMDRRFYDGDKSHLKNLFQCDPRDPAPDHCVRLAMLRWLESKYSVPGPTGVLGYHSVNTMLNGLVACGIDADRVRVEAKYLLQAGVITAEHQRRDVLDDADLIELSPSGAVQLSLIDNMQYLAACAEDVWYKDGAVAERIAERVGSHGMVGHLSMRTQIRNAKDLVAYLDRDLKARLASPEKFLERTEITALLSIADVTAAVERRVDRRLQGDANTLYVRNLPFGVDAGVLTAFIKTQGCARPVAVRVPRDGATGRSRGFAFVQMQTLDDAERALEELDGAELEGRTLSVREAL